MLLDYFKRVMRKKPCFLAAVYSSTSNFLCLSCVPHLHDLAPNSAPVPSLLNCINLQYSGVNVPTLAHLLKDNVVVSRECSTMVGLEELIFPS